ncbi:MULTISPECIES: ABC transporter substrate-binding protein [unclassified Marinobacter]|jgi:branched-chain amino acid transport system substrate-binding protein|uniref:ABC transporter substrate-binding protein n=1 Tax=unclassified Marinobacter TaxID=83889 RepID=UPI00200D0F84|nr:MULTISPECIES: ABC transporter substrate-binding protein [unclassified Marinobacter]MCL1478278.1 ABC transporter substrate-binding protein [Marinobacter sp.]MCL1480235.1 ABC transporter substrate-binding protein [Marinobacter sp.]MCL1483895.1 ABC transporter substrate-binding protein [Marinobacter sp.]MCL1487255.1 ABC transporter substrate-binding protein [Marinobacter sp.]UQG55558.1 ABC transporter substrate-binding protein [Marinobacter sp. M4C]
MLKHLKQGLVVAVAAASLSLPLTAAGALSDDKVKIGVLSDMSGVYKSLEGPGAVIAAEMAIEDFGGSVMGKSIELISADHQNKPDIGASTAREWIDTKEVDMITALDNSSVALSVQGLAKDKKIITMNTGAGSTALTEEQCSPYGIHYVYDTHALPVGTATAMVKNGGKKWFFITADYAFGHSLRDNTGAVVESMGGEVVGNVNAPLSTNDFSSYLLQAQSSGADVIGLANAGQDTVNAIKQANQFRIVQSGQKLAGMLVFLTDVHSMGLDIAQGLQFTTAFVWNQNEETKAWSNRFNERHGAMPTMVQAGVYSAVSNYLKAVKEAGTDDTETVRAKLGEMTLNDVFVKGGKIAPNGSMLHDMYLVEVKKPSESKSEWDLLNVISKIPADQAYISMADTKCSLVN